MDSIFMNSENSKTSDPQRILFNLSDKINVKRSDKNRLLYQTLAFAIHEKILNRHINLINIKHQLQHGMKSLNYLMDHVLYQIFKTILSVSSKNTRQLLIILQ